MHMYIYLQQLDQLQLLQPATGEAAATAAAAAAAAAQVRRPAAQAREVEMGKNEVEVGKTDTCYLRQILHASHIAYLQTDSVGACLA